MPAGQPDVVSTIRSQHATIRELFEGVLTVAPEGRADAFEPLIRLLAVHETAEEEVVYPIVEGSGEAGRAAAEARKAEEDAAKKSLARLEGMDMTSSEFMAALAVFRADVEAHADAEELEILPLLEEESDERREFMARAFAVAEATAPTHGHRLAPESAIGNLLIGPFVAAADRVRDAIRDLRR